MTDQENRNSNAESSGHIQNTQNLLNEFGAGQKPAAATPPAAPKPIEKETVDQTPAPKAPADEASPAKENTENKKPASAPKKSSSQKKSGAKTSAGTNKKAKSENAKDKPQSDRAKATTASPVAAKKEKQAEKDDALPRSARPAHRIIPFVLIVVAVFMLVSLTLNLFCNQGNVLQGNEEAHWMGRFGYYICYGLFGTFGPAVFVLPFLLLNLAFFWKRYIDSRVTISKMIVSALFVLILGAVIHVVCLTQIEFNYRNFSASDLLFYGAQMTGGGVLGGKLGYWMFVQFNVTGSIILAVLLLAAGLFYVLGMTPQNLWNSYRERRALRAAAREESTEKDTEKSARPTTGKQMTIDDKQGTSAAKQNAEEGASNIKKNDDDKLAPMPLPKLEPNDGSTLFVPRDVNRKMREAHAAKIAARKAEMEAQKAASAPTPQPQQPTAPAAQAPKDDSQKNRDTAVDPIFPKTAESKQQRRVPRADRNFDLKNVFVDLDDDVKKPTAPQPRKHAPVPPEVPLSPTPRKATGTAPATPQKPATPGEGTPASAARPAVRPNTPPSASKAPSLASVKPAAATPATKAAPAAKPIFRAADNSQKKDFGLSNEEFEKLEAERMPMPAKSGAKAAAKPAEKDGKAAAAKPAPAKQAAAAKPTPPKKYVFPPISYLQPGEPMTAENRAEIQASMTQLADTLASFHVRVQEINYSCGPTVTRYEVILAPGVRVRTITNLADDIALALRSSGGVRIEAPIPGTNAVGIEVPNKTRSTIYLRDLIESKAFAKSTSKLSACLGADIAGDPIIFDIAKMPHLLVAGTTGSGKSVCINCIIMSLLYKVRPDEVKLILIDPKKVEFSIYKNIPHLMAPVVTTPKDAAGALQAAVEEMERRFEVFENVGVRDIKGYNTVTADDPDMPFLPHMVIIIDELADLMMTAKNEVETAICRIAQKARAAGMHLIIGTQRPSADVVTGLIKANVPSSIAFAVKSQIDSRVILDHGGAEALTGRGDMLFVPIGAMRDTRVQGAFVDDKEVEKICEFIRATNGTAQYDEKFISKLKELAAQCGNKGKNSDDLPPPVDGEKADDPKYADAVRVAIEEGRISTSLLQRKLEVGYSRAAKLIDRMQSEGIVSPPDGSKPRSILISKEEYFEKFLDNAEDGQ